jgi:hypothetical protein
MEITPMRPSQFATEQYAHVRNLIPEPVRAELFQYAVKRAATTTMKPDTRVPGTPAASSDPYMEDLLEELVTTIEHITGLCLYPTYSYFRVYKFGDILEKHTDRSACEISVSVALGYVSSAPWSIWLEGPKGATQIEMHAGDAVIYRGIDCPHWRDAFGGTLAAQVFLHYVDQNGPLAEWRFDKRKRLETLTKCKIKVASIVRLQLFDPQVLELTSGMKIPLNPLEGLLWKGLIAQQSVRWIVGAAMNELGISEPEAVLALRRTLKEHERMGLLLLN